MATVRGRPIWMERPTAPTSAAKAVVLAAVLVVMVFPFVYVVAVSFASEHDLLSGGLILWPAHPTLAAYRALLAGGVVARALLVSAGVTVAGTAVSMFLTTSLAYGLSRTREVPGSRVILFCVLATLLFGTGIIPNYLLIRYLGLLNSYWSLILPGAANAFNLVIVRQFFVGIPPDLIDSARIDGAHELQILGRIVMPLSKAVLAVIALFFAVGYWNDYFNALLYINDAAKWPVQLVLQQYVLLQTPLVNIAGNANQLPPPQSVQMAVVVLAMAPILLVYPFLQRYFTTGVLRGAIKG